MQAIQAQQATQATLETAVVEAAVAVVRVLKEALEALVAQATRPLVLAAAVVLAEPVMRQVRLPALALVPPQEALAVQVLMATQEARVLAGAELITAALGVTETLEPMALKERLEPLEVVIQQGWLEILVRLALTETLELGVV